jgi:hypothetical protein
LFFRFLSCFFFVRQAVIEEERLGGVRLDIIVTVDGDCDGDDSD